LQLNATCVYSIFQHTCPTCTTLAHTCWSASSLLVVQFRDLICCGWPNSLKRTERFSSLCAVCWRNKQMVHMSHLGQLSLTSPTGNLHTHTSLTCRKCLILSPTSCSVSKKPSLRTKSLICSLFQRCIFTTS